MRNQDTSINTVRTGSENRGRHIQQKCPYCHKDDDMKTASDDHRIWLKNVDGKLSLKTNHQCYYQVINSLFHAVVYHACLYLYCSQETPDPSQAAHSRHQAHKEAEDRKTGISRRKRHKYARGVGNLPPMTKLTVLLKMPSATDAQGRGTSDLYVRVQAPLVILQEKKWHSWILKPGTRYISNPFFAMNLAEHSTPTLQQCRRL